MAASAIFYLVAEGTRSSHPRTLHEPHWEPGTYVATLTPETTQQHIDHPRNSICVCALPRNPFIWWR